MSLGRKPEHDPESGRGLERSTSRTEEETLLTPELPTIYRLSAPAWKSCAESGRARPLRKQTADQSGRHGGETTRYSSVFADC